MIHTAAAHDSAAIDRLLDTCFGPARRARTAYRLREGVDPCVELVARDGDTVIGSIQLWPLLIETPRGGRYAATLLGPLAVDPARRSEGLGSRLVDAALVQVAGPVVLIGDAAYYERWGFSAATTSGWSVPGAVDRARLLVRDGGGLPIVARLGSPVELRRAA